MKLIKIGICFSALIFVTALASCSSSRPMTDIEKKIVIAPGTQETTLLLQKNYKILSTEKMYVSCSPVDECDDYPVQAKALEKKAAVAQIIYIDSATVTVRFWGQ